MIVRTVSALALAALVTLPAAAQDDDARRVEEMRRAAEHAMAEGHEERARELMHDAEAAHREWEWRHLEGRERDDEREFEHQLEHMHGVLHGLEHGMEALMAIDQHELAEELQNVAQRVRQRIERMHHEIEERERRAHEERAHREAQRGERRGRLAILEGQIDALEIAAGVFREIENEEALRALMHAIEVRHFMLERPDDPDAREAWRDAPNRETLLRILDRAEHLYREFEAHDRADRLSAMTEEHWPSGERERGGERERRGSERVHRMLEIMRSGMPALREAGRMDTAELLEHMIHAYELRAEGRDDEDARHIMETAPDLGQMIEILRYAGNLWEEFGHREKAAPLYELAEGMRNEFRQRHERGSERDERIQHLARVIEEMQERLHHLMNELEEIARDR